ncbi:MAG: ATP-dependent Clp protease adaptor ClpS [Chloroflexi bacterium]|nr:ATP-dependent Clp protease adaptor ClpS [Chloroflexota bacterium]
MPATTPMEAKRPFLPIAHSAPPSYNPAMGIGLEIAPDIIQKKLSRKKRWSQTTKFLSTTTLSPLTTLSWLSCKKIFELTPLEAEHVTFIAHSSGLAYVATFPKSEAQKRVGKAHFAAGLEGFPLHFSIEPE